MKKLFGIIAAAAIISSTSAMASDADFYGNVTVTSDYVFRGYSQTDEKWAAQATVGVEYNGFYVEGFASPVSLGETGMNWEFDAAGGYRTKLTDALSIDGGVIGYWYPNSTTKDLDFYELYGKANYAVTDGVSVFGSVNYSPNYSYNTGKTLYWNGGVSMKTIWDITATASIGYLDYLDDKGTNYTNWTISGEKVFGDRFAVKAAYYDTNVNGDKLADGRFVLSGSILF